MTEATKTRRLIRAYVSVPVEGSNYPEMDAKAREYAAKFFQVDESDLVITTVPTIVMAEHTPWSADPTEPDSWRGTFRVGCLHPFGPDDHIPGPEFPEEDLDTEDEDPDGE